MPKDKASEAEGWEEKFDRILGWRFNIGVVPDDMTKEVVKNFIRQQLKQAAEEEEQRILTLIQTHTEHEGRYCDTGGDMDWACRSECMQLAVKRLTSKD